MKLIDTTCPHCGAKMKVDAEKNHIVCEYCGSALIIEEEKTVSEEDRGYQFERGRQKAKEEYKKQVQMASQQATRKKKLIWLWVLGWIYCFPIPLTILLARNQNMNPKLKKGLIAGIWGVIALFIVISLIFGATDQVKEETAVESSVVQELETLPEEHYDESLKGRGNSDHGRDEPQYVNVIGYIAVPEKFTDEMIRSSELEKENTWTVPTYAKDKQFWEQNGAVSHKTEVIVRESVLEKENLYGKYKGYLLVERRDTGEKCYIDVDCFVTKKYWEFDNARDAAEVGDFTAEFHQRSDFYPVDENGKKMEIADGTMLLVTGTPMSTKTINDKETNVKAYMWIDEKSVRVYVNSEDLTF